MYQATIQPEAVIVPAIEWLVAQTREAPRSAFAKATGARPHLQSLLGVLATTPVRSGASHWYGAIRRTVISRRHFQGAGGSSRSHVP